MGGNVILQSSNDITVTDAIALSTNSASLTLDAGNELILNANVTTTNGAQPFDGAVILGADATVNTGTGAIALQPNSTIDVRNTNISLGLGYTSANGDRNRKLSIPSQYSYQIAISFVSDITCYPEAHTGTLDPSGE